MFNINDFRNRGIKAGARPSLFEVTLLDLPSQIARAGDSFRFTCRASQIPPAALESVDVPYFGRKIKLVGDRTYPDWNVTIINDENYQIRNMFESWSFLMNSPVENIKYITKYKSNARVTHFGKNGLPIKEYMFEGIFPTTIDAMPLDWDTTNTIQTFDVTFAYDYWIPAVYDEGGVVSSDQPVTGNPGGVSGFSGSR